MHPNLGDPPENAKLDAGSEPSSWRSLVGVVVLTLGGMSLLALGLLWLRAHQLSQLETQMPRQPQASASLDVDLSQQGILIVEYGGQASAEPQISAPPFEPSPRVTSVPPVQASESEDDTEFEPETENEASTAPTLPPLLHHPLSMPPHSVPHPKGSFLVTPPALGASASLSPPRVPGPKVSAVPISGGYQVLVGPFSESKLGTARAALEGRGYTVREQFRNGAQYLQLGDNQDSQEAALQTADEITRLGYEVTVRKGG